MQNDHQGKLLQNRDETLTTQQQVGAARGGRIVSLWGRAAIFDTLLHSCQGVYNKIFDCKLAPSTLASTYTLRPYEIFNCETRHFARLFAITLADICGGGKKSSRTTQNISLGIYMLVGKLQTHTALYTSFFDIKYSQGGTRKILNKFCSRDSLDF
jgi:hypothetical protein